MEWKKISAANFAAGMKIISEGPREGEDSWDVIERANLAMGLPPSKRRRKRSVIKDQPQ